VNGSHNMMGICDVPLANFVDNDKLGGTHTHYCEGTQCLFANVVRHWYVSVE
jgi:hypothetical protein